MDRPVYPSMFFLHSSTLSWCLYYTHYCPCFATLRHSFLGITPHPPCKLSCSEPQRMLLSVELPILCFFNILASMFLAFSKLCFPKGHIVFTIFKLLVMLSGVRLVQVLRLHPVQVPVLAVLMGLMLKLQTPCIQAGTARRGVLLVLDCCHSSGNGSLIWESILVALSLMMPDVHMLGQHCHQLSLLTVATQYGWEMTKSTAPRGLVSQPC